MNVRLSFCLNGYLFSSSAYHMQCQIFALIQTKTGSDNNLSEIKPYAAGSEFGNTK